VNDIRQRLFYKMTALPISYFDRQPMGRTITRMTHDVEGIETFFSGTLARILVAVIQVGAVLTAMILTSPEFGFWISLACLPSLLASILTRRWIRDQLRVYKRISAQLNARFAEFISGINVIKLFGLEQWSFDRIHAEAMDMLYAGLRTLKINSLIRPIIVFLCGIPTLVVLWWGGHQVIEGTLTIAALVAFMRYCERFMSPIRTISQEIQLIQEALVSSERVRQMLSEQEEVDTLGPDGHHHAPVLGELEFDNVVMEYLTDRPVLDRISFKAAAGSKIALVGHTGSGKTSTVHLVPRLYPFKAGKILIDGVDIKNWQRSSLRDAIGYVSQDVVIFRGTLRDNLLSAASGPTISDQEILIAALRTGLLSAIQKMPNGLDTMILDDGANLSQGERQLIAFTRMLLKDPAIMILDEATANIDEQSEALIQNAVHEILENRTCLIVAHRLSTVVECDEIVVFEHGKIIGKGPHHELLETCPAYRKLVAQQLEPDQRHQLNLQARPIELTVR
jgi:ABC-type multidrug transport system fused ATPase/permease subunit